jgi:hypothetical protein
MLRDTPHTDVDMLRDTPHRIKVKVTAHYAIKKNEYSHFESAVKNAR